MKRFKDYSPDQQLLLAPDLNDWLEEGHLAYFIRDVVGELGLSPSYDDYHSQRGRQGFRAWTSSGFQRLRTSILRFRGQLPGSRGTEGNERRRFRGSVGAYQLPSGRSTQTKRGSTQ